MDYSKFVEVYEEIAGTTKRLEKVQIIASFLRVLIKEKNNDLIYLLMGRVLPDYDSGELGISDQIAIKAMGSVYGIDTEEIVKTYKKVGDLGDIAEEIAKKRRQSVLFNRKLRVDRVFDNLRKIIKVEGKGAIDKKIALLAEILNSASPKEAKYIIRTILGDLRIGIAEGILRDSIAEAFFPGEMIAPRIGEVYDLINDWSIVLDAASKGFSELEKVDIIPGRPVNVMLPVRVENITEAFEVCGSPVAIEHKYDGFRVIISKNGDEVKLYTRKLENVTKQFPDVVEYVKKYVEGKTFILDSEVVGYDPKNKKYMPFEAISQRIKRKYDIDDLIKKLPVEVNVFDILYYNGKSLMKSPFIERREVIDKIIETQAYRIRPAVQFITEDHAKAEKFYKDAIKNGEEGIMIKKIDAPYQQGRRVGYIAKLKPDSADLDLVITRAEYGSGKRGGWLTSYTVACRDGDKFLEIGKVSSGLKEKEEEGFSYEEMSNLLRGLIKEDKGSEVIVKPKIVVSVKYQNIQKSPSYDSGFALRFPRITRYRPDRNTNDIASLEDIKKEFVKFVKKL